jgi:hypothetical protein
MYELKNSSISAELTVKEITDRFAARYSSEIERKITPHWMGFLIRRKLRLKTEKRHGIYFIASSESSHLDQLFEKYGVTNMDSGASGDSVPDNSPEQTQETSTNEEAA